MYILPSRFDEFKMAVVRRCFVEIQDGAFDASVEFKKADHRIHFCKMATIYVVLRCTIQDNIYIYITNLLLFS